MTNILLVLVVSVSLACGAPLRSHHHPRQADPLTGSDFLAVFMRNQHKHRTEEPRRIQTDIEESNDVFINPGESEHGETSRFEHPEFKIEFDRDYPILASGQDQGTTNREDLTTLQETTTTQEVDTEPTPSQVVSVRVSSSVVRSKQEKILLKSTAEQEVTEEGPETLTTLIANNGRQEVKDIPVLSPLAKVSPEKVTEKSEPEEGVTEEVAAVLISKDARPEAETILTTEDRPTVTAVQRSQFGVDEPQRRVTYDADDKVVTYSEEHTVFRVEGRQGNLRGELEDAGEVVHRLDKSENTKAEDSIAEASQDYAAEDKAGGYGVKTEETKQPSTYSVEENPIKAPISYQTSVSSATSGSRVEFYRGPISRGESREPKNYELPERVYGRPEQNYEVDEAVSVVTNGRAHGVQETTEKSLREEEDRKKEEEEANHKFGYVVEGRNYRKYRVEERTPDGFIVGEYGVVSHNDGQLRGVRYTADRSVNPRLIYQALVKFLSLH